MEKYKLYNGIEIPKIGYGTWQTKDGEECLNAVKTAIEVGYTHIDTAAIYGNEASVAKAIELSGVKREDLFITSKVWNSERGYEKTKSAFFETLKKLNTDYLDLYLIHWPANSKQYENYDEINLDTWNAMIDLYLEGKIKAIGVSNFQVKHLEVLMNSRVKPMVNQIEIHPGFNQSETYEYCVKNNILVQAWSPLANGKIFGNEILEKLSNKYQKSVAQICVAWCLEKGICPLPKSLNVERMKLNKEVFDFKLSLEDVQCINEIEFFAGAGIDSDQVDF